MRVSILIAVALLLFSAGCYEADARPLLLADSSQEYERPVQSEEAEVDADASPAPAQEQTSEEASPTRDGGNPTTSQGEAVNQEETVSAEGGDQRGSPGYVCSSNVYNCADFSTRAQAQAVHDACFARAGDVHGLDRDNDGITCEALP